MCNIGLSSFFVVFSVSHISLFSFSLYRVLVGAPEASTSQPNVDNGGAVYKCPVTPLDSSRGECEQVPFDQTGKFNIIHCKGKKATYHQLRARRALSLFKDVLLRTRRALSPLTFYSGSTLLVLSGTSLNIDLPF